MPRKLREENGVRLPVRVWRVIDRVRDGGRLCKSLRPLNGLETDTQFFIEPHGRRVPGKKTINEAIIARWNMSGLKRIKKRAWGILTGKVDPNRVDGT